MTATEKLERKSKTGEPQMALKVEKLVAEMIDQAVHRLPLLCVDAEIPNSNGIFF